MVIIFLGLSSDTRTEVGCLWRFVRSSRSFAQVFDQLSNACTFFPEVGLSEFRDAGAQ